MTVPKEVKPGQVWADNDDRAKGRTLCVEKIEKKTVQMHRQLDDEQEPEEIDVAVCMILTDSHIKTAQLGSPWLRSTVGRTVRIRVSRFRPSSYKLIKQVEG